MLDLGGGPEPGLGGRGPFLPVDVHEELIGRCWPVLAGSFQLSNVPSLHF